MIYLKKKLFGGEKKTWENNLQQWFYMMGISMGIRASTRLCTYDLPRLCTCDFPRLCTYDFVVNAIRMHASCAMGHSNVLVCDIHVLFGTKMIALLLGSMVFCIVNAKHAELLSQYGFDLRVEKSCLSSLTGLLLCCLCNLSCEFSTQKFCQRQLNLVVEMLVIFNLELFK